MCINWKLQWLKISLLPNKCLLVLGKKSTVSLGRAKSILYKIQLLSRPIVQLLRASFTIHFIEPLIIIQIMYS